MARGKKFLFTASNITLTGSPDGTIYGITATAFRADGQAVHSIAVTYVTNARVEWGLAVPMAASYEVFARWVVIAGNSASAVFTVHHAGGSTPVTRSQQASGGQWVSLGTFSLAPGVNHRVELKPVAGGAVVADAVRIVSLTPIVQGTIVHNVFADHLDTPRLVTTASATPQEVWKWNNDDAFGANAPNENPSGLGVFTNNLRLAGQYADKETNLHYNYFRDYDSAIGRYVQSDPIGLEGGINTYAYVGSNPLRFSDPMGEAATLSLCLGGPVACAAGVGSLILMSPPGQRALRSAGKAIADLCTSDGDKRPDCRKATKWDLRQAGILDEHAYKRERGAVPEAHFDICKCKDGTIRIAAVGTCGKTSDFWD